MVNANKIRTVPDIELTKFSSIKINIYINYTTNCAKSQPILINYSQNRDFTHSLFSVRLCKNFTPSKFFTFLMGIFTILYLSLHL